MSDDEPEQPQTIIPSSGPDRDEMAANYLPETDEHLAKTVLDINDPHAVAALRQFDSMFPEVAGGDDELQGMIDDFIDDFLKGRPSIGGGSREEYKDIIMAMFGSSPEDRKAGAAFAELLGADQDDD